MSFDHKQAKILPHEVVLTDHEDETATSPARAVFNDGSVLEFPLGLKFVADNHIPDRLQGVDVSALDSADHPDLQVRLLIQRPPTKDAAGRDVAMPNLWLPKFCQKAYVLAVIDRIKKGV